MKRVLITGGAGFIGSHLCRTLLQQSYVVDVLDNFLTGQHTNVIDLESNPFFRLIAGDVISDPDFLGGPYDYVAHLASPASPRDYFRMPVATLRINSAGTLSALRLARRYGARFLLASTSEVYGDPDVHPQPEEYAGCVDPTGRRAVYDEGKRYAEALTMAFRREYGVETGIARIFNTYGPRMRHDDGRVIPAFITAALRGEPLSVYGDGFQTRSFCYVSDLVRGLFSLLLSDVSVPVNIGNPAEVTIAQLAAEIVEATGSTSEVTFGDALPGDPQVRCPDIARAKELLGWYPTVDRAEGLRRMIEYYRAELPSGNISEGIG